MNKQCQSHSIRTTRNFDGNGLSQWPRNRSPQHLLLTEPELCAWIGQANVGDRVAYHRGFLAIDVAPETLRMTGPARSELGRVANRARTLAQAGAVHLVQRREGPGEFTYLLIVRPRLRSQGVEALLRLSRAPSEVVAGSAA